VSPLVKGLVVAVVQVGLVASLGAKLLYDRATLPRVWVRSAPYDPTLPIRGRYVRLQLVVSLVGQGQDSDSDDSSPRPVSLGIAKGQLVGEMRPRAQAHDPDSSRIRFIRLADEKLAVLDTPVAYFIPEHVPDPLQRPAGEELWVEVSMPTKGAPRPIRLGVKKGDGPIVPLDLR